MVTTKAYYESPFCFMIKSAASYSNNTPPALSLSSVCHRYGDVHALRHFNLDVAAGEVVCLLGPSGCGKTTALRIAAGLEGVTGGEVKLSDRLVASPTTFVPPEERGIGLVFQDYALFPHLPISENVAFGLVGTSMVEKSARVAEVLEQVGMGWAAERYHHELSGGQQQRVALARALAPRPAVILLDEPFSGLDARLRDQVRDQTLHALQTSGAATLMVTHDAEEAMYLSDRVVVMQDGSAVQTGRPDSLYDAPANAFVAAFFGEVNRLPGVVESGAVSSALGMIDAPGFKDGDSVEIVVRPEAIGLRETTGNADGPGYAVVEAARMLGRSSLVHMFARGRDGSDVHLHARCSGRFLPREDTVLAIELDSSQAFVFPVEEAK